MPLTESRPGSWCVIARIDNSSGSPRLINVNQTGRAKRAVVHLRVFGQGCGDALSSERATETRL